MSAVNSAENSLARPLTRKRIPLPEANDSNIIISARSGSMITLKNPIFANENVHITRKGGKWYLKVLQTDIGVSLNGVSVEPMREYELMELDYVCIASFQVYYKQGHLYLLDDGDIVVSSAQAENVDEQLGSLEYPEFIRSTRFKHILQPYEIEVLPPKAKPAENTDSLIAKLIPVIISILLIVVVRGMLGNSRNMTFIIYSVCTMFVSGCMTVYSFIKGKKKREEAEEHRQTRYVDMYIQAKIEEIKEARKKEFVMRHQMHRPYSDNLDIVRHFSKGLFDRTKDDSDFMDICIGEGTLPAQVKIKINKQEYKETEDPLMDYPIKIEREYANIDSLPVVARLLSDNAIGIIGARASLYQMLKLITIDLCVRQYYKEVKFLYVFEERDLDRFMWVRWLKNCRGDDNCVRNLAYDDDSAKFHLDSLFALIASREEEARVASKEGKKWPEYQVIFVFDLKRVSNHPVSQFFETANKYGVMFLFFSEYEDRVPLGCKELIRLSNAKNEGYISNRDNDENRVRFTYPEVTDDIAREIVRKLCPVYVVEASLEGALTKSISLYETLSAAGDTKLDILSNWNNSQVSKTLRTPLGVKANNELVYLDLHEKGHGPHGLVAGTTGSGKSELMQSYILSIAVNYHPHDVCFLIIDFKAGGMVNQFENLPHLIGAITNLEGNEVQRSLKAIRAEKVRRESLFAYNKVNNIDDYIRRHKQNPDGVPALPHLIIIVDEFGELRAEQPDFMAELISIARVGRSLGIHLILATQKPAGIVNDQILSNSKFKLCLKVQSREDSNEMLSIPLAAEIREPGRAYLKVGNGEILELFQSAYSGAKVHAQGDTGNRFVITQLNPWGQEDKIFDNRKTGSEAAKSELQDIIDRVADCCKLNRIQPLNKICMSPMVDLMWLSELKYERPEGDDIYAAVGMYDDPEQQKQDTLLINLTESNTYLVGASQTGKTVLLQTIITNLTQSYAPDRVCMYVVDGGDGLPKSFETSPIVGGICYRDETERMANLVSMLKREIAERRKKFASAGVGNYRAYIEAGDQALPWIIVAIDNAGLLKEFQEGVYEALMEMSKEALGAGITFFVTAASCNVLTMKLQMGFGTKLTLNCNDAGEYSNMFSRCRMEPKDNAGRGLIMMEKRILEYQTAWYAEGKNTKERNENAQALFKQRQEELGDMRARPIPMVPDIVYASKAYKEIKPMPYRVPIGISYTSIDYEYMDLLANPIVPIIGRARSGRTNFVKQILAYLQFTRMSNRVSCYVVDDPMRQLGKCEEEYGYVESYTVDVEDGVTYLGEIVDELKERRDRVLDSSNRDGEGLIRMFPLIMLVIEHAEFAAKLSKDADGMKLMEEFRTLARYRAMMLIDNVENRTATGANAFDKLLQSTQYAIITEDVGNIRSFSLNQMTLKRQFPQLLKTGDAYVYAGGNIVDRLRTILDDSK